MKGLGLGLGLVLGLSVSALACLLGAWEFLGIADGAGGIPTISRVVQGLRDQGLGWLVAVLSYGIAATLGLFGAWVLRHFTRDHRSTL